MTNDRNIKVTLTADVSAYVKAMEDAALATSNLGNVLLSLGVTKADLPEAIRSVIALVRKDDEPDALAV